MKLSHKALIVISGLVWLVMGIFLLQLGLGFLVGNLDNGNQHLPVVQTLASFFGGKEIAAIILILFATYLGYFKGRYVLGKSAKRGVERIYTLDNPAPLHHIYNARYYLLIGIMVALGLSIKYMGLSNDIRGIVDILIGSALVNGSIIYFRLANQEKSQSNP